MRTPLFRADRGGGVGRMGGDYVASAFWVPSPSYRPHSASRRSVVRASHSANPGDLQKGNSFGLDKTPNANLFSPL
jgi:hypothetical protein